MGATIRPMGNQVLRKLLAVMAVLLLLGLKPAPIRAEEPEEPAGIMILVGPAGERLLTTGLRLQIGDKFIDSANEFWYVHKVEGEKAFARRLARLARLPSQRRPAAAPKSAPPRAVPAQTAGAGPAQVVIYHSHSDESYVPTDGTHSINGKGGIYPVGATLAAALREQGLRAEHRQENHNPRDHGAYLRSRRTALHALAEQNPAVMFDVHRDAAPAREYMTTIAGEQVAQVLIVIGHSNPGHAANVAFARLLKEEADARFPGLVKGIFMGRGNYNQDLFSRSLLLEAGSHEVTRAAAERGMALLAAAVPPLLQELAEPESEAALEEGRAAWGAIARLLVILPLLAAAWLALTTGGLRPALARLRRWWEERGRR